MNTGDLIFFQARKPPVEIVLLSRSNYTHVGMIVAAEEPDDANNNSVHTVYYVLESDVSGDGYQDGVRLIPLDKKWERYNPEKCFMLKINTPVPNEKIFRALEETLHYMRPASLVHHALSCIHPALGQLFASPYAKSCSEYIVSVLKQLDLVDKNFPEIVTPEFLKSSGALKRFT